MKTQPIPQAFDDSSERMMNIESNILFGICFLMMALWTYFLFFVVA